MCIHSEYIWVFLDIVTLNKVTNNKTILPKDTKQRGTKYFKVGAQCWLELEIWRR